MHGIPYVNPIDASHCPVCGKPLNVHQRVGGGTCDRPACRHIQLRRRLLAEHEQEQALCERAEGLCREMAAAAGLEDQETLPLAILPFNDRVLVDVPEKRRRRFRDRLMSVISAAAARLAGQDRGAPHNDDEQIITPSVDSPQLLGLLAQGCAICRGDCCHQGGDHAFIFVETICSYMAQHPGLRPRHVLEAYLSHIGPKAYQQACLYQGSEGCRLQREMRSRICNDYLCPGLVNLLEKTPEKANPRAFAVANKGGLVRCAALINSEGRRTLETIDSTRGGRS